MEPGFYLTTLVFAIAALHLINKVVTFVTGFRASSGMRPSESSKQPVQRDDWYMFFHRSDLTGKPVDKNETKRENALINSSSSGKHKRRDSRPTLRRHLT